MNVQFKAAQFPKLELAKRLRRAALRKEVIEFRHPNPNKATTNWPEYARAVANNLEQTMFALGPEFDVAGTKAYRTAWELYGTLTGELYGTWEDLPGHMADHGEWETRTREGVLLTSKPRRQQEKFERIAARVKFEWDMAPSNVKNTVAAR